jgi:hypothetical protein
MKGTQIQNHFARFAYYSHADGSRVPLYTGYRDYLKPLHLLAHTDEQGMMRYVCENTQSHVEATGLGGAVSLLRLLRRDLHVEVAGKRVLDVGCGDGALAFLFASHGAEAVDGIELEERPQSWHPDYLTWRDLISESVLRVWQS